MIKIKHFLDAAQKDDGQRLWVEPIGLTRDLVKWCKVDHVLPHLGPPRHLWDWFEQKGEYDYYRGCYHEALAKGPYRVPLQQLACASMKENITLLHQAEDPEHNTATALYEYLSELEAYCPDEGRE